MMLRNGDNASDWYFLAMAHWQNGNKEEAGKWFDKAVEWTQEKAPQDVEVRWFWKEAAELLGKPGPDPTGHGALETPYATMRRYL
jgi:hypothetical protein